MKDTIFIAIEGAIATIVVFGFVFVFHLLFLAPKRLYDEAVFQKNIFSDELKTAKLEQSRIKLDVADSEGRKELEKTKLQLTQAQAALAALDPIRQPVASANAAVDVIIKSDENVNSMFMDRGGYAVFGRDSSPLLMTNSRECNGRQMGAGRVVYHGVFSMPVSDSFVGKPITELRTAKFIQVGFAPMPLNAQVLEGRCVFTINGTTRLEFQIPPQIARGDAIVIVDLTVTLSKLNLPTQP